MARQNQGLQIALIVFVVLTIALGVMTFLFSNQANEAAQAAADAKKTAQQLKDANLTIQDENNRLKVLMGFAETMKFDEISTAVNKDLNTYAANFEGETRGYHQVLPYLYQTLEGKSATIATLEEQLQQVQAQIPQLQQESRAQIAQHEQRAAALAKAKAQTEAQRKQAEQKFSSESSKLKQIVATTRTEAAARVKQSEEEKEKIGKELQKTHADARKAIARAKKLETKTFEVPDGKVQFVDHRNKKVWIDLGRADSLPSQMTFAVYPADVGAPTEESVKGSIEVLEVSGDHLAEARILSDSVSDPIMPGDKIHTPIWTPGEKRRFALAGSFDINEDGRSDLDMVKNLITMNGGQIDAVAGPDGGIEGNISLNTRFLVLGDPPKAKGKPGVMESYSRMRNQAERFGVEVIPVGELLDMMGYRPQTFVARFGQGASGTPERFRERNRQTDNPVRSSGQPVSGRYGGGDRPVSRGGAY